MARKVRMQYPGAIYHVMNRGDRREAIFQDDEDRERRLQTLAAACQKTGWQVHADCLMGNHLGEWGIPKDSAAGRRVFEERMEWRRGQDLGSEFKRVERGWCLGGEEFRQELLEPGDTPPGPSHFGEVVQEAEAVQAERLVVAGLQRMGWREADLKARRKGESRKVELAWHLRAQTPQAAGVDCGAAQAGQPRTLGVAVAATRRGSAFRPRRPVPAENMTISILLNNPPFLEIPSACVKIAQRISPADGVQTILIFVEGVLMVFLGVDFWPVGVLQQNHSH